MNQIKIVVERHSDGYVAYPFGLRGVVVGEGDSYDEALTDFSVEQHLGLSDRERRPDAPQPHSEILISSTLW